MRIVRARGDARWLPSRFHLALFRLYAYARISAAAAEERPDLVLAVDAHQSALEAFFTAAASFTISYVYFADLLTDLVPLALALLVALPVTPIAIQIPLYIFGLTLTPLIRLVARRTQSLRITNALYFAVFAIASYFMLQRSVASRIMAVAFFSFCILELIAMLVAVPLRERMKRVEERVGGVASGVSF